MEVYILNVSPRLHPSLSFTPLQPLIHYSLPSIPLLLSWGPTPQNQLQSLHDPVCGVLQAPNRTRQSLAAKHFLMHFRMKKKLYMVVTDVIDFREKVAVYLTKKYCELKQYIAIFQIITWRNSNYYI